jgi:hypothetical protein
MNYKNNLSLIIYFNLIAILFFVSCKNTEQNKDKALNKGFVYLQNGKFYLKDKPFYPLVLNYRAVLQTDGSVIWPSAYKGYDEGNRYRFTNSDSCVKELTNDFRLIADMGFNAIRIVGIGEQFSITHNSDELAIKADIGNERDTTILFNSRQAYQTYFNALKDLLKAANHSGLKVILLARMFHEIPATEKHWGRIMKEFNKDTTIMAYDFFNEPLYFDSLERNKVEPYYITREWQKLAKENAPNQLTTIGLTGIREVFEWDPNILDVDFISYHPYEYEKEQVRNEIYWYGNYVKKPWIIGETSLPADNDSIPYSKQKEFAEATFQQTCNCGGAGYSWWQYKDVEWFEFHSNFMGVVNRKGITNTSDGEAVLGTPKNIVEFIKSAQCNPDRTKCLKLENYYNYSNANVCRLYGKLVDASGNPIEGGVVMAWNQYWSSSFHTVTKQDGSFELLGSFPFYHWMASATLKTMIRGDVLPDTANIRSQKIPSLNLGTLKLDDLKFN